jgi:hypothetical protein
MTFNWLFIINIYIIFYFELCALVEKNNILKLIILIMCNGDGSRGFFFSIF